MHNGDLWKLFYKIIHARGAGSVWISWTKGHALEHKSYLLERPGLRYQAQHNHRADQLASHAFHTLYNKNAPVGVLGLRLILEKLQLHSPLTKSQQQAHAHGTLQIPTRKFRGLGVVHFSTPLQRLSETLSERLFSLESSAGQPRPGRDTVFSCPSGHTKLAQAPFDVMHPGKQ
eukprot:12420721-Karenia_brevis.AAC.1